MSDHVIITGVRRGNEFVPVPELKQMCIGLNTRILTVTGYKEARRIKIGDELVGIAKDGKISNGKVLRILESKKASRILKFSNGSEFIASSHPLFSWNGEWINSDCLRIGDKIRVITSAPPFPVITLREKILLLAQKNDAFYCRLFGDDLKALRDKTTKEISSLCSVSVKSVCKIKKTGIIKIGMAKKLGFNTRFVRVKTGSEIDVENLDYDNLSWFLGVLASDGNIQTTKSKQAVRLQMKDLEIVSRFHKILLDSGIKNSVSQNSRGMWVCEASSATLVRILVSLGFTPRKTRTLNLQEIINLPQRDKAQFISGYIDGDGCFSKKQSKIRICSASRKAIQDLKDILLSIGVVSVICESLGNGDVFGYKCDTRHWNLVISHRSMVQKLIDQIDYSYKLPDCVDIVKRNTRGFKEDTWWTRVKSIAEAGESELINFTVSNTNTFICEDIVTHNCGRIGRTQDGQTYATDIILHDEDFKVEVALEEDKAMDICSGFNRVQNFCFAAMPWIVRKDIKNLFELKGFYDLSLASYQEASLDLKAVLAYLEENEAIERFQDGSFTPALLGMTATRLYMHASDVRLLRDNFLKVLENHDLESDGALAWALGNLDTIRITGDFGEDHREEISRFREDLPFCYDCREGTVITSALWWCMLGNGISGKNMATNVRQLKQTWPRLKTALAQSIVGSEHVSWMDELDIRIRRGLRRDLVPFFSDPEMTKGKALMLLEMGYKDATEAKDVVLEEME